MSNFTGQPQTPIPTGGRGRSSGLVTLLTVVIFVLLLLLIGGSVFVLVTNNAFINSLTGTAVSDYTTAQYVALVETNTMSAIQSFTPTPTNTSTPTPTPTDTPTNTPTNTPNQTQTLDSQQLATYRAADTATAQQHAIETATAHAGETATAIKKTQQTATAAAGQTLTKIAQITQTAEANLTETADAILAETATAEQIAFEQTAESATQTEAAKPTDTPTPTRTPTIKPSSTATRTPRVTKSPTPAAVDGFTGTPDEIMSQLVDQGLLDSSDGNLVYQQDTFDLSVDKAESTTIRSFVNNADVADFVLSTNVTWDAPEDSNGCGLLYRYVENTQAPKFYIARITRQGTYQIVAYDKSFQTIKDGTSTDINVDDGATNQILLIGQGDTFRLFINGKLTATVSDSKIASGNLGVAASRFTGSRSLTCHFENHFAYELTGGGSAPPPTAPPTAKPKATTGSGNNSALATSLLSSNPDDIINALVKAKVATGNPKLVTLTQPTGNLTTSPSTFNVVPMENTKLTDIVLSTDITFNATDQLACGVMYNGQISQGSFISVFIDQSLKFYVFIAKNNTFQGQTAIVNGISAPAIIPGTGVSNRITLVVVSNKATVYINGQMVKSYTDKTFPSGVVGYFIVNVSKDPSLECDFENTYLWRLK